MSNYGGNNLFKKRKQGPPIKGTKKEYGTLVDKMHTKVFRHDVNEHQRLCITQKLV